MSYYPPAFGGGPSAQTALSPTEPGWVAVSRWIAWAAIVTGSYYTLKVLLAAPREAAYILNVRYHARHPLSLLGVISIFAEGAAGVLLVMAGWFCCRRQPRG